jgi:pimeloyl-ACP methyl ester carboxylesterase
MLKGLKIGLGVLAALALALVVFFAVTLYAPDLDRAELESRYSRGVSDFVDVNGLRFHVRIEGPADAPPVILIHGYSSMLHSWDGWVGDLAQNYKVIRYDLAGHGLTGPDPSGLYSPERDAALLLALMDKLGLARAALVGNSLGGQVAWNFAARHPDRVASLTLIAPGGYPRPGFDFNVKPTLSSAVKLSPYIYPRDKLTQILGFLYADPQRLTPQMIAFYHDLNRAPGVRRALVERLSQYILHDPGERLRSITAPVLIVWGEKDIMVPFATDPGKFMQNMPHARLVTFPDLGHVPQEEDPARSLLPVKAFLQENG